MWRSQFQNCARKRKYYYHISVWPRPRFNRDQNFWHFGFSKAETVVCLHTKHDESYINARYRNFVKNRDPFRYRNQFRYLNRHRVRNQVLNWHRNRNRNRYHNRYFPIITLFRLRKMRKNSRLVWPGKSLKDLLKALRPKYSGR